VADWGRRGIFLLPFLFLGVFYLYPLLAILRVSFGAEGGGLAVLTTFGSRAFWRVVWFTTWQAGLSTLLTLLASLPMAYVFATYTFPGKRLLHALLAVPFVMPSVVVAMGFLALFGRTGLINQWLMQLFGLRTPPLDLEQSIWLILLANIFYNVSVIVRTVGGFWGDLNPHLRETAAVLGADGWRTFRRVTLPLLLPSVLAASSLVFLFCFTSFSLILILGGPNFATLEVEIYRQAVNYFNLPLAAFLSLVQMALTFAIMVIYTRYQARTSRGLRRRSAGSNARRPANARQWLVVVSLIAVTVIGLAAPLLALVVRSFTLGGGFTLRYYAALAENPRQSAFFVPPIQAVANSLTIAVVGVGHQPAAGGDRRLCAGAAPQPLDGGARPAAAAAAGHLGGDAGLRLHHRAGAAAHLLLAHAHRPCVDRAALRRAHLPAQPARLRRAPARGRGDAGRGAGRSLAADRPAAAHAAAAGGRGLRLHHQPGRIRRHAAHRPARPADNAHGGLPAAGPAGAAQLRPGAGHEHGADGGDAR
jgi:ABC-type spermidine/putrescine transport system permease subunit II